MSNADATLPAANDGANALLRLVADAVPAMMAYYGLDLKCLFANRRYAESNGLTVDSILGKSVREVIGEDAWQRIEPHVKLVQSGQPVHYVREQVTPTGETGAIEVNLIPHSSDTGEQIGAFVLINEITRQWRAERALRESELRMRKFVQASNEGIVFHHEGLITDVNEALPRMGGYSMEDMVGRSVLDFVPREWRPTIMDRIRGQFEEPYEAELLCKNGDRLPVELVGKVMPYNGENHRMVIVRDITMRKQAQERIEFLALHDALTQLPNRLYLDEYMERTLALAKRQQNAVALFFIDLDDFKQINDTLGHQAGDEVLREAARRLRAAVRESDLVARLGGDEFLIVLTNIESVHDTERVASGVLAAMQPQVLIKRQLVTALPSIGIAVFPYDGDSMDELILHADSAMYEAKNAGGNRYKFADDRARHVRGEPAK